MVISVFVFLFTLTFFNVWFMLRPTGAEKKTVERLRDVIKPFGATSSMTLETEGILRPATLDSNEPFLLRNPAYKGLLSLLESTNSNQTPTQILMWSVLCGIGTFFILFLLLPLPLIAVAVALVGTSGPVMRLKFLQSRRLNQFEEHLPESLDLMARALRSGHALNSAIEVVADQGREPVASEFKSLFQQQSYGLPFKDALEGMMKRVPSADLQFACAAMMVQKETGGNLAEILDRTVEIMRERAKIRGEVRTKTAQGRLTGMILALLPVGLLLVISFTNPEYAKNLTQTPTGHKMLYASAAMITVGWLFINKIVNIEV